MRINKVGTVLVAATAALVMGLGTSAHATDGDQFFQVDPSTGHSLSGICRWYGVASDQGTTAVLQGTASADATAIGTTIECWLRFAGSKTRVPNTTTRAGMPGSTATTQRNIIIPPNTSTYVCAFAQALYLDGTSKSYKTFGC